MALLYDAAVAWDKLLTVSYQFTYVKKRRLHDISLSFQADQFSHLSGAHYVRDVDLKNPYSKGEFLSMVLSGEIDAAAVEKSADWEDIKGRLEGIVRLESILNGEFSLYLFRREILPFYSSITANYLIKNLQTGESVFLFVDGPLNASFCKSIFTMTDRDYSKGQTKVSLLKKCKYTNGVETILFNKLT